MTESSYQEITQLLCAQITLETNLISQLSIDSIKLLNLIMEIEDTFDISIPINALTDIQTVGELADLVYKIKSEA